MTEVANSASGTPGSAGTVPGVGAAGQTDTTKQPTSTAGAEAGAKNYEELEKKLGEQGKELGDTREFIKNITPLLTKLDTQPELIQAIMDGKIDSKLVVAALEGKVKIEEAQQVAQAHEQVKQAMGQAAYTQANPEEIEKKIFEKLAGVVEEKIDKRFKDADEQQSFEESVTSFIATTKDFPEYADKVNLWLNEHPNQDDIEVAYNAVKGIVLSEKFAKDAEKNLGEAAKNIAANAGGGASGSTGAAGGKSAWDQLVAPKANPNNL